MVYSMDGSMMAASTAAWMPWHQENIKHKKADPMVTHWLPLNLHTRALACLNAAMSFTSMLPLVLERSAMERTCEGCVRLCVCVHARVCVCVCVCARVRMYGGGGELVSERVNARGMIASPVAQ